MQLNLELGTPANGKPSKTPKSSKTGILRKLPRHVAVECVLHRHAQEGPKLDGIFRPMEIPEPRHFGRWNGALNWKNSRAGSCVEQNRIPSNSKFHGDLSSTELGLPWNLEVHESPSSMEHGIPWNSTFHGTVTGVAWNSGVLWAPGSSMELNLGVPCNSGVPWNFDARYAMARDPVGGQRPNRCLHLSCDTMEKAARKQRFTSTAIFSCTPLP